MMPVAQRYSALAAGGGDIRTSVGARILGRYDKMAWAMLAASTRCPSRTTIRAASRWSPRQCANARSPG
jgi:hypothetical protein